MRKMPLIAIAVTLVVVVCAATGYWLARHHYVKTNEGTIVLQKRFLTWNDTFVDIRRWTSSDFDAHPKLRRALVDQGYRDVVAESEVRDLRETLGKIGEQVGEQVRDAGEKLGEQIEDIGNAIEEGAAGNAAPRKEP